VHLLAILALTALAVALPSTAVAHAAKAPKAPGGLKFYKPPKKLPAKAGAVVWSRTLTGTPALKSAGKNLLVLYRTTTATGKKTVASGTVSIPKGKAPKGGWPVISWTHATTGIADVCAPSRDSPSNPSHPDIDYVYPELNAWLKQGWAVVRTDYQGLGTPGTHPYLIGAAAAHDAVDIIRAGRHLAPLSRTWVAAGHSQGGHAALFTAALGPKYAPELKLKGVASFAPASHIGTLVALAGTIHSPGGALSGTGALFLAGAAAGSSTVHLGDILTARANALVPQVEQKCLSGLSKPDSWGGVAPADLLKPGADLTALNAVLAANDPSALKLKVPVLLLQGLADSSVPAIFTNQLDTSLVQNGAAVTYKTYPATDHYPLLAKAEPDALAFLRQRLG
jgi:pimeloyl-ACP methyl ester carboxylesterase